jgi:hypothetical protein
MATRRCGSDGIRGGAQVPFNLLVDREFLERLNKFISVFQRNRPGWWLRSQSAEHRAAQPSGRRKALFCVGIPTPLAHPLMRSDRLLDQSVGS